MFVLFGTDASLSTIKTSTNKSKQWFARLYKYPTWGFKWTPCPQLVKNVMFMRRWIAAGAHSNPEIRESLYWLPLMGGTGYDFPCIISKQRSFTSLKLPITPILPDPRVRRLNCGYSSTPDNEENSRMISDDKAIAPAEGGCSRFWLRRVAL